MNPTSYRLSNNEELIIREAEPQDAGVLLAFMNVLCLETDFTAYGPGEYEDSEESMCKTIERNGQKENCIYCLAFIGNEIVGMLNFVGGVRTRNQHAGIFGMSVTKTHWRKGIGDKFVEFLVAWAQKEGGIKKIDLRVRTDNTKAIALYLKAGFVIEGRTSDTFFFNGTYYDHYIMGLSLTRRDGGETPQ